MTQMSFKWPVRVSYAAEDFILSESNEHAAIFLEHWPDGNSPGLLLAGPASSGKTHLAHRWANRVGATFIAGERLGAQASDVLWGDATCAVLENIETLRNETALFHLLRHVETHGVHILLTSALAANALPFTLPDLRSRLLSYPLLTLDFPDETLLRAFIVKCFSDHQMRISEEVISFLLHRMERSLDRARMTVEMLIQRSCEAKRDITIPWIKSIARNLKVY